MNRSHRISFVILILLATSITANATPPGEEIPMGPLGGRNLYAPHLPWYSFPAERAGTLNTDTFVSRTALYFVNEFSTYPIDTLILEPDGRLSEADQNDRSALDYESTVWELGLDWQVASRWRVSIDWRLHFRYGGAMDALIEGWHSMLGTANAGREYFDQNRSHWNIKGSNISGFSGEGIVVASGDIDLKTVFSFLQNRNFALAGSLALKLPTGAVSTGFSTGYPDIGLALLMDWHPWNRWIFYANVGAILPLGPEGRLMGQFIPAVEFRISRGLSILLQMNLQTSPIQGKAEDNYIHPLFGESEMFSLMQTDFKIGLKGQAGRFGWQLYIEEDPFTWEGPDILVFLGAAWSFTPRKN